MNPRLLMVLALASTLSACAPSPLLRGSLNTLQAALAGPPTYEPDPAAVAATPFPQLKITSPYGEAGMLMGRIRDGEQLWVASSREVLVIRDGLVRRTTGFPDDLQGTRLLDDDPFAKGLHLQPDGARFVREVDWEQGMRFGVRLHTRLNHKGLETVEILGVRRELLRIDEQLRADGLPFEATNRYWVDPADGFIFLSLQHLAPGFPVTLTQLRPYRETGQ